MVYAFIIGLVIGITILTIRRCRAKRIEQMLYEQEQNELNAERQAIQTQINFYTAKRDNLLYTSELVERQYKTAKTDKECEMYTRKLQTLDNQIFTTEQKLNKLLECLY